MNDQTHRFVAVPDGNGGTRHVLRPVGAEGGASAKKRKSRTAPDPIRASGEAAAQQLARFIERLETIDEEARGIADDRKDVLAEAKGNGFDTRTMNAIVKLRRMEGHVRQEAAALLETYKSALGLA